MRGRINNGERERKSLGLRSGFSKESFGEKRDGIVMRNEIGCFAYIWYDNVFRKQLFWKRFENLIGKRSVEVKA